MAFMDRDTRLGFGGTSGLRCLESEPYELRLGWRDRPRIGGGEVTCMESRAAEPVEEAFPHGNSCGMSWMSWCCVVLEARAHGIATAVDGRMHF